MSNAPLAIAPQTPTEASNPEPQTISLTQKTWVVPPRPKPGRKPATDAPLTKRKAQNRVAQRAFRERKAAKVSELGEQMQDMVKDHQAEVEQLKAELRSLSSKLNQGLAADVSTYGQEVRDLRLELQSWKETYTQERTLRERLEQELAIIKGEAVSLPKKRPQNSTASTANTVLQSYGTPEELPLGCSRCSLTHCQCLEEALNMPPASATEAPTKRPMSPSVAVQPTGSKKTRTTSDNIQTISHAMSFNDDAPMTTASADRCGFCKDGTTCLCAELAAERERPYDQPSSLPSPPGEDLATGLPIEIDFTTYMAPAPTVKPTTDGPGTCEQCRNDPNSKGFCKGLAAMHTRTSSPPVSGNDTISCARAFNQLKQHPEFERASKNVQEWLPRLTTASVQRLEEPVAATEPTRPNHTAFEIDSASVLGVLKYFDRRFGRDA